MIILPYSDCIKCCFGENSKNKSVKTSTEVEVFFAETANINTWYPHLIKYVSKDEQCIADNFNSDLYKKTYLSCHAMLRLILAAKLHVHPYELSFINGKDNKPGLPDNPAFFNISHTKDAFAIAYTRNFPLGIDLENTTQNINIQSVIEICFSRKEYSYILDSQNDAINRFFLLWTRKEALLKAIGTGIINNLKQIDVSEPVNHISKELFDNFADDHAIQDHFIYSVSSGDYILSLAVPEMCSINFYNLNEENLPVEVPLTNY